MIGSVIHEQYLIRELLGEGGMGVVYKALDQELDRIVALKFLKGEFTHNPHLVKRFRDELKVLAAFNHPNITMLHTSFNWQGGPVMVMELLDGETFSAMIGRRGPIPAQISVPLVLQALAGVAEAHRRGIIHRDIKPANLMLTSASVVKVMDFGIAKMEQAPGLTRTATIMGTPYYASPEQVDPAKFGLTRADYRTDIYSMGVTLYELLAGEVPFQGASEFSIQRAHLEQEPQPPTVFYPHIPAAIVAAVMRAMAKDPRDRFQNAEEFARALDFSAPVAYVTSQPSIPMPLPQTAAMVNTASAVPAGARMSAAAPLASSTLPAAVIDPARIPASIPVDHLRTAQSTAANFAASIESADPGDSIPPLVNESIYPDAAATEQTRPLDGFVQRWFGHTGRPRIAASAVALLVLLLLALGGFGLYEALNRTTEAQPQEEARYGGEASNGATSNSQSTHPSGDNNAEFHLPRTTSSESAGSVPASRPETTPNVHAPTPVHPTAPTAPNQPQSVVAGVWTGSYTGCADRSVNTATMSLSESAATDESKLIVSGRLRVSTNSGDQSCAINGTFTKKANRLILKAACASTAAPEYLSPAHTNFLSLDLSQNQLNGIIQPDSPCVTISFKKR